MASKVIYVGSKNPVKLAAMKAAFVTSFPTDTFEFIAVDAPSGVPDQPMGDAQTLEGARNRVAHLRAAHPDGAFYAGIEGGCERLGPEMFCTAWMVVHDDRGLEGKAKAGSFFLPNSVTDLVDAGDELGTAVDKVFNRNNSKQGSGAVGSLTGNLVTRQTYYERPCIMALIPFLNRGMFTDPGTVTTVQDTTVAAPPSEPVCTLVKRNTKRKKVAEPADPSAAGAAIAIAAIATPKGNLSVSLTGVDTDVDVATLQAYFAQHGPVRKVIRLAARAAKGAGGTAPEATATEAGTYAAIVIYADGSSAAAALAAAGSGGTVALAGPAGATCMVTVTEGPSRKKLKKG